ncbi:MAG: M20/M25/M40 family metallo-hydrolase [Chitinivibrionales bacterium]|nr:M20/M25/M40 family metallo-hydrolase [Chitinivibrionales bacterium]
MKIAVIYNKHIVQADDVIEIFGPQTRERYNPKTVENVASALEKGGHNVRVIEGNITVAEELRNFMPSVLEGERPGMVFNMAYGIQGQSRYTHIPAMLEMLGVPYIGSGPQAHAIALDKVMSKIIFKQHNLPTPRYWLFSSPHRELASAVVFPAIVKPKMEAVSMGITVVHDTDELLEAVQSIIDAYKQQALVEEFIAGREFAVGLLGNGSELETFPVVEFNFSGNKEAFQSHDAKMQAPVDKICPAKISEDLRDELQRLACEAFYALGTLDFARIDFRIGKNNQTNILELNSMASLGMTGSYIHAANKRGYSFDTLINRIVEVAAIRYFGQQFRNGNEKDGVQAADESMPLRVRLRSHVRGNISTILDNVKLMTRIDTNVNDTEGVNSLGSWVSARLKHLGFERRVFPQTEVGNILYFSNHDDTATDILVLGHLDTVYAYSERVPYREARGRIYGSGVAESKGGLAVMLGALQALRFTRRLKKVRCGILLITDDTLGGKYSGKLITDFSAKSKYVAGLKYGGRAGGIVTSCGGVAGYSIIISHPKSLEDSKPSDVISAMAQKIIAIQRLAHEESGIELRPTSLEAKTVLGLSTDFARAQVDVFFCDEKQAGVLDEEIRKIAKKGIDSKMQIRVRRNIYSPPLQANDETMRFYEKAKSLAEKLEIRAASIHRSTASCIGHVKKGIPVLEGLGPAGGDHHSAVEYIVRDSLIDRATLLALIIRTAIKEQD